MRFKLMWFGWWLLMLAIESAMITVFGFVLPFFKSEGWAVLVSFIDFTVMLLFPIFSMAIVFGPRDKGDVSPLENFWRNCIRAIFVKEP